jgi:acetylornithine deacetylase/succinyl-diaminopimelate desuccinylase-like protein
MQSEEGLAALAHAREHRDEHLEILLDYVARPSISTQNIGVLECAEHSARLLTSAGCNVQVIETAGYPVVLGTMTAEPDAPTLLLYGHYDVQPPEPIEAWISPAFEPEVRDGRVFGRGVADNKGQHLAHILAIKAYNETAGRTPINVKLILEGEEEAGSPHLDDFVRSHRDLLACDLVITSDGGIDPSGRPLVSFGVRGMLSLELEARGAAMDLHSGRFGNLAPDPAMQLIDLLASMRGPNGRITIDGFYDDVRAPTQGELELAASVPFDPDEFAKELGLAEPHVTNALDYARGVMFEPTMTINGIASGHTGEGAKSIIASNALVRLEFRLVVDQDPDAIFEAVKAHVAERAPQVEVCYEGAMAPSRSSAEMPVASRLIEAVREAGGQEPVITPSAGGSLPDYVWTQTLGVPSVLVPYANHDENNHSPNENLTLDAFYGGIETSIHLFAALGQDDWR